MASSMETEESIVDKIQYLRKGGDKLAKGKEVKPTIAELVVRLKETADDCMSDAEKIVTGERGANVACARVRKSMQLIKKLAQQIRVETQTLKNIRKE